MYMEKPDQQSPLPKVEQDDILFLVFDDVTSTDHAERWEEFATSHPVLALELRARITIEAKSSEQYDKNSEDIRIRMMSIAVFAVNALEQAARRSDAERLHIITNVGADDEDQQLST